MICHGEANHYLGEAWYRSVLVLHAVYIVYMYMYVGIGRTGSIYHITSIGTIG